MPPAQRIVRITLISMVVSLGMPLRASAVKQTEPIAGVASVIDGDTIEIHGRRIRLHGIDAPESRQTCFRAGEPWRCGLQAALALSDYVGRSPLVCDVLGHDRYRRIIARCFLGATDINRWMVENGWAVAYRRFAPDYIRDEDGARADKVGVWSGTFMMPWDWRVTKGR